MSAACITSGRVRRRTPANRVSTAHANSIMTPAGVLLAGILSASCETTTSTASDVSSIEITPSSLSMVVGAARPLTARVLDASGAPVADARVFWSSEHPSIAMVTANGVVTGVSPGNTQIAASMNGTSTVVPVAVSRLPVSLVRLNPAASTVLVGASSR
jgi:uncharacterized protein YjdB